MKKKNKNLKGIMAVILLFIIFSLAATIVMVVENTAAKPDVGSASDGSSLTAPSEMTESENIIEDTNKDEASSSVIDTESEKTDESESGTADTSSSDTALSEDSGSSSQSEENISAVSPSPEPVATPIPQYQNNSDNMKAMWISYLEFQSVDFKSRSAFVSDMTKIFSDCADMGLNTVIVQVRPFGDALYNSSVFPTSHLITGTQGAPLAYDPLTEMVQIAHSKGLRIEAWVNPYRVRLSSKMPDNIAKNNPANNAELVLQANGGVYYNPALSEVQDMVVAGIEEIVRNYDVDGIHLDDYFYPATDAYLDEAQYIASKTTLSQADWRRENVNTLVRKIYSKIKSIDSTVTFGISPQGNNDNNYNVQYSDVKLWLANKGYVDYIMPQLYWGFGYLTASGRTDYQFVNLCEQWEAYPRDDSVKLYIGLGAYRIGDGDGGSNDQSEWQRGDNLMRMISTVNAIDGIDGFALYRYDNLFKNSKYALLAQSETDNISDLLN